MIHISAALEGLDIAEMARERAIERNGRLRAFLALHGAFPDSLPFFTVVDRLAQIPMVPLNLAAPHVYYVAKVKRWRVDFRMPNGVHMTIHCPDGVRCDALAEAFAEVLA